MTGIFGAGRAFNLKYRTNGPLKIYVQNNGPTYNFFGAPRGPRCGGFDLMSSSTYIEYKPNFWDNLTDICKSFTEILFTAGSMGLLDRKKPEEVEQKPKPQGATSGGVNHLKNLQDLVKSRNITVIDEGDDKFTLIDPKTGKNIKNATYSEAQDWYFDLLKSNSSQPSKVTKPKEQNEVEHKDGDVVTAKDLADYKGEIVVQDDGHPGDITGTTTYEMERDDGYYTYINVGDTRYRFETDNKQAKDGEIWYKSVGGNHQSYRLEWQNGKIVLIQHKDDVGYDKKNY